MTVYKKMEVNNKELADAILEYLQSCQKNKIISHEYSVLKNYMNSKDQAYVFDDNSFAVAVIDLINRDKIIITKHELNDLGNVSIKSLELKIK